MPSYVWFPALSGLAIGFCFMNIPPVAPQFMTMFGVGFGGLSLFLSGLLWAHSLSQIPAGIIVDKLGPHRCLSVALAAAVALNLFPLAAPHSLALGTALRFLLGLCTGVAFLGVLKLLALLTPPGEMAKAQGFFGGAFGFGTMIPYFVLPYFGDSGWVASYLSTAALCALTLASVFLLPKAGTPAAAELTAEKVGVAVLVGRVVRSPEIWMLGLMHGMFYGTLTNLGQWLPSILADLSDGDPKAWSLATILVLFVGACSRWCSGYVLRVVPRRHALAGALVLVAAFYLALAAANQGGTGLAVGLLLAISCGLCYGAIFTMGAKVLPVVFAGTALGFLNTIANLVNVGLTLLFGNTREATGHFSLGLALAGVASLVILVGFYRRLTRLDARIE